MAKWQSSILSFCDSKRKKDGSLLSNDGVVDNEAAICQFDDEHSYAVSTASAPAEFIDLNDIPGLIHVVCSAYLLVL